MSKKRQRQRKQEEQVQIARQEQLIRATALALIVLVIVGIVWLIWPLIRPTPPATARKQYTSPPPMAIDITKKYYAAVRLQKGGEFVIELYADKAPKTVNNFVFLAREGFYNGVTFHRVIDGFMAQGGDPTGTGAGGPGYQFEDEFNDLTFDKAGVVAMANAGPNTNGSQFFITYGPAEWLNGRHTIFGQVIQGMEVVESLRRRDPQQNPDDPGDAIESIVIYEE